MRGTKFAPYYCFGRWLIPLYDSLYYLASRENENTKQITEIHNRSRTISQQQIRLIQQHFCQKNVKCKNHIIVIPVTFSVVMVVDSSDAVVFGLIDAAEVVSLTVNTK